MAIPHWPEQERPREKLLHRGPGSLSDAELLAIFLRTGYAGKSAVDLARDLVNQFGGLAPLLHADRETFCQSKGLGPAKYVQLQAVLELARRHLGEQLKREHSFNSPGSVAAYLKAHLRHQGREIFMVLFLDTRHQLIISEELFHGTIDGASIYPREVVKRALQHNAAAVILAHNHPSGVAEPSPADENITLQLREALALVDIRVLDHLIVGSGDVISLAERGVL